MAGCRWQVVGSQLRLHAVLSQAVLYPRTSPFPAALPPRFLTPYNLPPVTYHLPPAPSSRARAETLVPCRVDNTSRRFR